MELNGKQPAIQKVIVERGVIGTGQCSSSLMQGWRYLDNLNLTGNCKVAGYDYSLNIGAKATDDPRNDVKTISLTNLQGRITNKINTINLGDTFESFSQYSLNSAVKGGFYRFAYDKSAIRLPEVTIISGIAAPRRDSVWWDNETRVVERQVYGGRIKYALLPDLNTGFNIVTTSDDRRVLSTDPLYRPSILNAPFWKKSSCSMKNFNARRRRKCELTA